MSKTGFSEVIVGLDYGDEGKGRITDQKLSTGDYQIDVRFNGGNNAGHSLKLPNGNVLVVNSIPSGILHSDIINYIGSGCVVDPVHLIHNEIPKIEKHLKLTGRLKISALATAVTPIHILWDQITGKSIGTTGKGIGPAYSDRARRAERDSIRNVRLTDVINTPGNTLYLLRDHYSQLAAILSTRAFALTRKQLASKLGMSTKTIDECSNNPDTLLCQLPGKIGIWEQIDQFITCTLELEARGFIEKNPLWLTHEVKSGKNVLMEGAQAHGLDVTHGIPPFTTSSNTIAPNAYVGGDLPVKYHHKTIGVSKLICSRVGAGPFVGELGDKTSEEYCTEKDEDGNTRWTKDEEQKIYESKMDELKHSPDPFKFGIYLRMKTGEYGATTGRPRRVGIIDLVRLRHACAINGVDELYLTKGDCLQEYHNNVALEGIIPVISHYTLNGKLIDYIPTTAKELHEIKPITKVFATPEHNSEGKYDESFEALPPEIQKIVTYIQEIVATKIVGLGIGPSRDEIIHL